MSLRGASFATKQSPYDKGSVTRPKDYDGTSKGWDDFYIGAIKSMLEAEKSKPKPKAARKPARAKKPAVKKSVASKRAANASKKKKPSVKN